MWGIKELNYIYSWTDFRFRIFVPECLTIISGTKHFMLIFCSIRNRNISAPKHAYSRFKRSHISFNSWMLQAYYFSSTTRFVNASLFCFNPEHPALILRYMLIFIPLISQLIEVLEHITYFIFIWMPHDHRSCTLHAYYGLWMPHGCFNS